MFRPIGLLAILRKLSLACAAYVSAYMPEIAHMIKIIVTMIQCYNFYNQYYS